MTCARDLAISSGAPAPALRERIARVEKPNASNTLQQKSGSDESDSEYISGASARARASRFETTGREPLWYGPRLRPAFVAQVLGQVFASENASSAPVAYRRDGIPTGLLLDKMA
jgi:hypothetical protein